MDNMRIISVAATNVNRRFFKNIGRMPYNCLYVILKSSNSVQGCGVICVDAKTKIIPIIVSLCERFLINITLNEIYNDFGSFYRDMKTIARTEYTCAEYEFRTATSVIINALWDLWAKLEQKPLLNLLIDLPLEKFVNLIDFDEIGDVITREETLDALNHSQLCRKERIENLKRSGYPAYVTLHETHGEVLISECAKKLAEGFTVFRINIEVHNITNERGVFEKIRNLIGPNAGLILDVNGLWKIEEAVDEIKLLSQFHFLWIENPLCEPELEHYVEISKQRQPFQWRVGNSQICSDIGTCKKFLKADAIQYCEIDSLFHGSINEILCIYLVAFKLDIKVNVRGNHSGFCEMLQHLQMWDYIALSATMEDRFIECPITPSNHFANPAIIQNGYYQIPTTHGCNTELLEERQSIILPVTNTKERKGNVFYKANKITF